MKITKKIISIALAGTLLFSFAGCNKRIDCDAEVTLDNANSDYHNIAHAMVQSIFTNDVDLFYACYPEEAQFLIEDQGESIISQYMSGFDDSKQYEGIQFTSSNAYTTENNYNEDYMRTSISLVNGVEEERILDIQLVKERVFFTEGDEWVSSDVFVIVYELELIPEYDDNGETVAPSETSWYFFEFANSDAELN